MMRIANSFNEYAQMYNRMQRSVNTVAVLPSATLLKICSTHYGLPKHMAPEKLRHKREIKHFVELPVRGRIQ